MRRFIITLALLVSFAPPARAQSPALLKAMQEEMQRAMAGLRLKDEPPPYYIAYSIEDVTTTSARATLNGFLDDDSNRRRLLRVEVRVGDYNFDSSRFISFDREAGVVPIWAQGVAATTLDDDPDALGRQLWLTTDAAYKRAVSVFAKKKAAFQNRAESEPVPDFSRETPAQTTLPIGRPEPVGREWPEAVRRISAVFVQLPRIQQSEVAFTVRQGTRVFLNSEGFKTIAPIRHASVRILAEAQADDGMVLRDFIVVAGRRVGELPKPDDLAAQARALGERLVALRSAKVAEEFTGPVLVEGQAAGELAAQTLVPLFLAERPPDSENPRATAGAMQQVTPFLSRIGSRVLPEAFSASDTPSLADQEGTPVAGAYNVDDEGVPAQDVKLVENGRLVTLLTSRTPQRKLPQSNGHGRGGGASPGVFRLTSSQAVASADLRAKYLQLLKDQGRPFGYIVRRVSNPVALQSSNFDSGDMMMMMMGGGPAGGRTGPQILQALKLMPDGTEEPVRGLSFAHIPHTAFRDIVEASKEAPIYNYMALPRGVGALSGGGPPSGEPTIATVIVPSLLFEELELQKTREVLQKPPIVAAPTAQP